MDGEMTRQDIIRAALRVWGRKLYQRTSLGDVARELGVSKAALYRHFTGKEELVKAMNTYFYDDYACFLKPHYETALKVSNGKEGGLIIIRGVLEYYLRDRDLFVFSLIQVYRNWEEQYMEEQFTRRGIDIGQMKLLWGEETVDPSLGLLLTSSLIFRLAYFYKYECGEDTALSGEQMRQVMAEVEEKLNSGLALEKSRIEALEYERLETLVAGAPDAKPAADENRGILKAVGTVVAEEGPWNASMEMVARRSGLSKSGLYAHFKSKRDMLHQLFFTEFERIAALARKNTGLSAVPEERLYLGIFSIVSYLRSRPEILVAMNWVRTRRLNLGPPSRKFRLLVFEDIGIEALRDEGNSHWIFFLIVGMMAKCFKINGGPGMPERSWQPAEGDFPGLPNGSIRRLYRFISLGFRGFEG
jgi:AcrR family transcriptional regulator